MASLIRLENINKTYNNGSPLHVLKGIDLEIKRGELVSIMGASGSGKSTLLNILGILDDYDTGSYYLNGTLIKNPSETKAAEYRNRMIGFIFQSFNLINYKNAMENVALPLYYQGVSRKKRNAIALDYLESLGLRERNVRRTETTRRDRPRADYRARDHPRRRTDRRPGQQNVPGSDGSAAQGKRHRNDDHPGHPRTGRRRPNR